jgi:membrane protease subunit HflK
MIEAILNIISSLCFFTVVNPDESGVHLRCGRVHRVIGEGFHWQWPVVDEIQTIPTSEQMIDLPNQTLTTRDGQSVTMSGTVRYEVVCPEKTLFNVSDYDESIQTLSMEVIGLEVPKVEHKASSKVLKDKIQNSIEQAVYPWGINIISVGITDNAVTFPLRLYD